MFSTSVKDTFEIRVSLPRTYRYTSRDYPTLFILDGDVTFQYVNSIYDMLRWDELVPEMTIVSIGYGLEALDPLRSKKRTRDFISEKLDWSEDAGGAAQFLNFLEDELMPFLRANYRMNDNKILSGYSFGGFFVLYTMFNTSGTFTSFMAQSPSLWINNEVMLNYESEFFKNRGELNVKLYTSLGDSEPDAMLPSWNRFLDQLNSRSYNNLEIIKPPLFQNGYHDSIQPTAFTFGLQTLFKGKTVFKERLDKYAGTYHLIQEDKKISIEQVRDKLVLKDGTVEIPLYAKSDNVFGYKMSWKIWRSMGDENLPQELNYIIGLEELRFTEESDGAYSLEIRSNDKVIRGVR